MGTEASDMMALVRSGTATPESVREMIAVSPRERAELVSMGLRVAVLCRDRILAEFDALASGQPVPEAPDHGVKRETSPETRELMRQKALSRWAAKKGRQ